MLSTMAAGSIPIKKVHIDSRFQTKDSKSNSDFKCTLVESMQLPDRCVCCVDAVVLPVSWYILTRAIRTFMYDGCKIYRRFLLQIESYQLR